MGKAVSKTFNEQAAFLVENCLDLIKQVLVKHTAAVLEEMHDQIVSRNERISALEKNAKASEELYNAIQRELETARIIADRAEHRANQAESERDALLGDKDEYCEVLSVLGMEEEGSAIEEVHRLVRAEYALRDLLRIEFLRHDHLELPWNCVEEDCPRFGKPLYLTGCTCRLGVERKHVAAVKKELGL